MTPSPLPYNRNWLLTAGINLCIVALLGCLLRYLFVGDVPGLDYRNVLHAHSHFAFGGWLMLVLITLLTAAFVPQERWRTRRYNRPFWTGQVACVGMLCSFPVQGYGAVSIAFSTLLIIASVWFAIVFIKDSRTTPYAFPLKWARWALIYMLLSSVAPFTLGPIMATGNSGTPLYYNAIYFYLHFQYNGWFTFAVLSLFFYTLERQQIRFNKAAASQAFRWLNIACIPAYLLSVLWTQPPAIVYVLAGLAALLQVAGTVYLISSIAPGRAQLQHWLNGWGLVLWSIAGIAFISKVLLQLMSAWPLAAKWAYHYRSFIIGYLHLVLLGFITCFLLGYLIQHGMLRITGKVTRLLLVVFLAGLFANEAVLFAHGMVSLLGGYLAGVNILLLAAALLLFVGTLGVAGGIRGRRASLPGNTG